MPELQYLSAETTALLPPIPNQWLSHKYKPSLLLGLVNKLDLRIHDGFSSQQGSSLVEGGLVDNCGVFGSHPIDLHILSLTNISYHTISIWRNDVMFWNQQPKQGQTSDFRRRNLNAPKGFAAQNLRL
jgi:hypothetical protein